MSLAARLDGLLFTFAGCSMLALVRWLPCRFSWVIVPFSLVFVVPFSLVIVVPFSFVIVVLFRLLLVGGSLGLLLMFCSLLMTCLFIYFFHGAYIFI